MIKSIEEQVIFVDCFNTIILRKKSNKEIFTEWAILASAKYDIPWQTLYRTYRRTNINMSLKKTLLKNVLIEKIDNVLGKVFNKLKRKYKLNDKRAFITDLKDIYYKCEKECHYANKDLIKVLKAEKAKGKKIYVVSDFYCDSATIKNWLTNLKVINVFDDVFSSADFDKEKATKKLYRYLIKKLQLNKKDIIMLGDSSWSDVFMARLVGIHSKKIKARKER